jgi:hypothetical protein
MEIKPEEIEFTSKAFLHNGSLVTDDVFRRINHLTSNYLNKITTDESGWDTLYQDPEDKRYWEKVYLDSGAHGGGLPSLINISLEKAKAKYNF